MVFLILTVNTILVENGDTVSQNSFRIFFKKSCFMICCLFVLKKTEIP